MAQYFKHPQQIRYYPRVARSMSLKRRTFQWKLHKKEDTSEIKKTAFCAWHEAGVLLSYICLLFAFDRRATNKKTNWRKPDDWKFLSKYWPIGFRQSRDRHYVTFTKKIDIEYRADNIFAFGWLNLLNWQENVWVNIKWIPIIALLFKWILTTICMGFDQPWATQIGSRAKFMLNSHVEGQNRDAFYRFSRLFYEIGILRAAGWPWLVLTIFWQSVYRVKQYIHHAFIY